MLMGFTFSTLIDFHPSTTTMKPNYVFNHHDYYHTLQKQIGGNIHIYAGTKQRGEGLGNVLSFIQKHAIPLVKRYILPHAKRAVVRTLSVLAEGTSNV